MRTAPLAVITIVAAFLASPAAVAQSAADASGCEPPRHRIVSLEAENDMFGGGSDRHYTHGMRASYLMSSPVPDFLQSLGGATPLFDAGTRMQASLALGQSMFTPDDITTTQLQRDDRPYAGWTYLAVGLLAHNQTCDGDARRIDALELQIGVIGPASQVDEVQTQWHEWIGAREPRGWQHQLDDEPGIALTYERRLPRDIPLGAWADDLPLGLQADVTPHFGMALGNVFTHAAGGATVRIGSDLDTADGVPRIRPSLPGSSYFEPSDGVDWQIFAGGELRAVARNIFLDGNTFRKSHRVEKETFVADFQAGIAITFGRARLSFTNIFRSPEFTKQEAWDEFGAIALAFHL